MREDYSSSSERLANWFLSSRNKWKQKALHKQKELRKAGIKIRDLQKSREEWKTKAKEYKEKIKKLEEGKKTSRKKGEIRRESKPKNYYYYYSLRTISMSLQQIIKAWKQSGKIAKNWLIEKENMKKKGEELKRKHLAIV